MNGGIRLLSLSLLILTLCSCVSVSTLKKGDCQNANWQEVGILDGKQGSNSQKILKHIKTCQGKSVPDKALWETGRQIGLKHYCTKSNAYHLGRMGYALNPVCDDNFEELHHANMLGLEQYEMGQRLDYYRYGYFNPWWIWW